MKPQLVPTLPTKSLKANYQNIPPKFKINDTHFRYNDGYC